MTQLQRTESHADSVGGFDRVRELPLEIVAELGRKRLTIDEILQLRVGESIELERKAGAPIQIYANGTLIARGEAVIVDERYGVRITELVAPASTARRDEGHVAQPPRETEK